ncbi:phage portal protein [Monashia sp. NPDC004114]
MGVWSRVRDALSPSPALSPVTLAAEPAQTFSVDIDPVMLYGPGVTSATYIPPAPRISRREAMEVGAVKRSRELIAGALGSLPLDQYDLNNEVKTSALLNQPEPDVARSVTMTRTYEDMLFEGRAWWFVLARDWTNYPVSVRRLDPCSVTITPDCKVYVTPGMNQGTVDEWPADRDLIRFDSPNDPLLIAGARAIRTARALQAAASRHSDGVPPVDWFTPADGADLDDDEVLEVLNAWRAARLQRSTAYVPGSLKYNTAGWNPEQLQMAEAQQEAVLEIARHAGVDPEDLGVSTTSRTYQNAQDRYQARIKDTLRSYMVAFEDRMRMGDVTPRGNYVKTNLSELLRSDDKTRFETYQIGLEVEAITHEEIRAAEGKPPLTEPAPQEDSMAASAEPATTFDSGPVIRLDAPGAQTFEVDVEKRTIRGLAVPYGKVATSGGSKYRFSPRSLKFSDISRVKMWVGHDPTQAVGVMFEADSRADGMYAAWRIARGPEGDRALSMADDGVWDGLSVGLGEGGQFTQGKDGVYDVLDAPWMETSLTPAPAFDDARVHSVAASAAHEGRSPLMGENTTEQVAPETAPEAPDFSALSSTIEKAIAAGFAALAPQAPEGPQVIPAAGGAARFTVTEGPLYRFDGTRGQYDFSTDMFAAYGLGQNGRDAEAEQRVLRFMSEAFGPKFVTTTDTAAVNPTGYRPDMYVDQQKFTTPLRDAFFKGALTDVTPFVFPKLNTESGLVNDHVQGTEPTAGTFSTANGGTVTPAAVSGRAHITREVADQGGNPQVSQLIWNTIVYEYLKALENKAAAMLAAASPAEFSAAIVAGANTVANLAAPIEAAIAGLNFAAGGNRFNYVATHLDLYKALAALKDGQNRPYYPVINPTNANGQTVAGFKSLNVAGTQFDPVWSIGLVSDGTPHKSYLADTSVVYFWHSAPTRLDRLQEKVEGYDLGVWGYWAGVIADATGLQKITYDPV